MLNPLERVADRAFELRTLVGAGILKPVRPDKLARIGWTFVRWGAAPATGAAVTAIHYPDQVSLIDEVGSLTFSDVHLRSNALANSLRAEGVGPGDGIAIMCRNHRGFVEATLAASKLGANALYLNTAFAGPQIADVSEREGPVALVYDEEFSGLLDGVGDGLRRFVSWTDSGDPPDPEVEDLIAAGEPADLDPPPEPGRFIILTSGTTGTPKGAQRRSPEGLGGLAALLAKIPFRSRERMVIAAPMFHSWGFAHFVLSLPLAATIVLRRRFDPEETLRAIADNRAEVLVVVPVMLQRILALPRETIASYDLSSLRITSVSGSALPGELATEWMDTFGENLFNLYGSTEVAWATVATPEDLRAAPGTAGRPPRGTEVRIFGADGEELSAGETGRIFVGNDMAFEGYTGGGGKEVIDGLFSSGDVGHFDAEGRLFIDGRDDEMIVSGGENVFPREVEDLLAQRPDVAEVAVIGVDDAEFGQRLKAFIVSAPGKELDPDRIKAHVKANLARYKVPRDVEFLEALPRNATGKVLKRELARRETAEKS